MREGPPSLYSLPNSTSEREAGKKKKKKKKEKLEDNPRELGLEGLDF